MPSSILRNGFHVLGLSNSSEMKEILRRSNEITQFLELEEITEFDTDIFPAKDFRNSETARDALRRLQNPRLRFEDYFFWLDFKLLGMPAEDALKSQGWLGLSAWLETRGARTFTERRELLVSKMIALRAGANNAQQIFAEWKSLIESSAFWEDLKATYRFDGQLAASDELISTFRDGVASSLGDLALELASGDSSASSVQRFAEVFGASNDSLKEAILTPLLEELRNRNRALARIQVDDGVQIIPSVLANIKEAMKGVEKALNALLDAGLYDASEAKLARDQAALEMRRIVLDCHNHHNEFAVAHGLLSIAVSITGTDALRNQLSGELKQVGEAVDVEAASTLRIEVPGFFGGGTVILKNDSVSYGGKTIKFKDATSISYSSMLRSYNFVPYSQSYSLSISSSSLQSISIDFGTTFYIGNTLKKDTWARLAGIFDHMAGPYIVARITKKIFEDNAEINIGGITFSSRGYSKKRTFGGVDTVNWGEDTYIPKLKAGNAIVWMTKDGKASQMAAISMSTPNAVILPELVKACVERARGRD